MNDFTRVRAGVLTCVLIGALTCAASAAAGPLIALDSEQKAASAIVAADRIQHEAPGHLNVLTTPAFTYPEPALHALAAATTPAELAGMPGGMTLPCRTSGSFTARSTVAAPRVIDLEFHECVTFRFDPNIPSGPIRVWLLGNSFVAEAVGGLRLGTRDRDFIVTQVSLSPDQNSYATWKYNYVMQGYVAWASAVTSNLVPALSLFEVNGFMFEDFLAETPGREPYHTTQRLSAEHLLTSTSIAFGNDFLLQDEQTTYLLGAFMQEQTTPFGNSSVREDFAGLRVRRLTDYESWSGSVELDGGIRYQWSQLAGAGCLSGGYLFNTKKPLHQSNLDMEAYDSGELVINRDVTLSLYSADNAPAGLPVPANGMLLHVDVKHVGSFDYDTSSLGPALQSAAGCPN